MGLLAQRRSSLRTLTSWRVPRPPDDHPSSRQAAWGCANLQSLPWNGTWLFRDYPVGVCAICSAIPTHLPPSHCQLACGWLGSLVVCCGGKVGSHPGAGHLEWLASSRSRHAPSHLPSDHSHSLIFSEWDLNSLWGRTEYSCCVSFQHSTPLFKDD